MLDAVLCDGLQQKAKFYCTELTFKDLLDRSAVSIDNWMEWNRCNDFWDSQTTTGETDVSSKGSAELFQL